MITDFGQDRFGSDVNRICISNGRLSAHILSYGAILQDLYLTGHASSLVLGFQDLPSYLADESYVGAIVGRVANRIRHGSITVDGEIFQLDCNLDSLHQLHGGADGTAKRNWQVVDWSKNCVVLQDILPDGHMGYPGELTVQARFEILDNNALELSIEAHSNSSTLCNFTHHSYFNLGSERTVDSHLLKVIADNYLETDFEGFPTGRVASVSGADLDFRIAKRILKRINLDHNFCINDRKAEEQIVAILTSPMEDLSMSVSTTAPGLQLYSGDGISPKASQIRDRWMGPRSGIAIEPQFWPDAPNHDAFPSIELAKGDVFHQKTLFSFSD